MRVHGRAGLSVVILCRDCARTLPGARGPCSVVRFGRNGSKSSATRTCPLLNQIVEHGDQDVL